MKPLYQLLIYGVVGFAFMFVIAKILGKKQIAQLDFLDYIIGISLGSIAAEMAFDTTRPIWYYLVGMALFALLDLLCSLLGRKSNFFKKIFIGQPLILVADGKLQYRTLNRSKLSLNEFLAMCRAKGYFDLDQIAYCILETSGSLSVLPKGGDSPATKQDVGVDSPKAALSKDVVMDGQIVGACLAQLGKDEEWLFAKLDEPPKAVKQIALATYHPDEDRMSVHYK